MNDGTARSERGRMSAPGTSDPSAANRRIYNPVQRDGATFLETAEDSGGARTLLEIELAAQGGNLPHRHLTYDEHFEVLEGVLSLRLGDDVRDLAPGAVACAPAGTVHCFANKTEEVVAFRVELRPGHRGMERSLQIGYALAAEGRTNRQGIPRNPLHLGLLLEMAEMTFAGPMRLTAPAFKLLAAVARQRGIDRELVGRYCQI